MQQNKGNIFEGTNSQTKENVTKLLRSLRELIADPLSVEYASLDVNRMKPQSGFILNEYKCPMVDFVGKWESAHEDFEWVMHHIYDKYNTFPKDDCLKEM